MRIRGAVVKTMRSIHPYVAKHLVHPSLGASLVAYEVASHTNKRYIFRSTTLVNRSLAEVLVV